LMDRLATFVKILETNTISINVGSWTKVLVVEFFICHSHAARMHLTWILAVGLSSLLVQKEVLMQHQLFCLLVPATCHIIVTKGSGAQIAAELARQRTSKLKLRFWVFYLLLTLTARWRAKIAALHSRSYI